MQRRLHVVRGGAWRPTEAPPPHVESARDRARAAPLAPVFLYAAALFAFLFGGLATSSLALALGLSVPLALAAIVGPRWARRSTAAFDRDLVTLLARGATDALPRRLSRAWGMLLFADRDELHTRVGRVAAERGDLASARRAYARALGVYRDEDAAPLAVRLGYAHASYALADDLEACWAYRRILAHDVAVPRVAVDLAHALYRRGAERDDVGHAIALARPSSEEERATIALLRALLAAKRGDRRRARVALASAGDESPRVRALRTELWCALGTRGGRGEGRILPFAPRTA